MRKSLAQVTKIKTETQKDINTKNMLDGLCHSVLKKNHDLYLTHEEDMEKEMAYEIKARKEEEFNERMEWANQEID